MKQIHLASGLLSLLTFFVVEVNAQSIIITPKWTAQAQFAGYYVAEKMGFYKEEGLEVHIRHPFI